MITSKKVFRRKRLMLGVASALTLSFSSSLFADVENLDLDLKSKKVAQALTDLGKSAGVQIMVDHSVLDSVKLAKVQGTYSLSQALNIMLKGTGLVYEFVSDDLVVVKESDAENRKEKDRSKEEIDVEELVVTGSRIVRDPGKLTKQMEVFSRDDIEKSGVTKLDEFLRRLPQNINAPTNVASGASIANGTKDFGLSANIFAGSSANLRGLGAQYTLILIDGKRPAKGGQYGELSDISNFPTERVERIEILYDGAAALYGADAIGGVINIVTNRDYQGTEVSLNWSGTEDGGAGRYDFNLGHTFSWDTGSATVSVGLQKQAELEGNTRNIDFAPVKSFAVSGDQELTLFPGSPANIGTGFTFSGYLMAVADLNGDGDTLDENERLPGGERYESRGRSFYRSHGLQDLPDGYAPVYTLQLPETWANPDQMSLYDVVENTSAPMPSFTGNWIDLTEEQKNEYIQAMRSRFPLGGSVYEGGQGFSLLPDEDIKSVSFQVQQEFGDVTTNLSYNYTESDKFVKTANDTHQQIVRYHPGNIFNANVYMNYADGLPPTMQDIEVKEHSLAASLDWTINDDWNAALSYSNAQRDSWSEKKNSFSSWYPFDWYRTESSPALGIKDGYVYDTSRGINPDMGDTYYWPASDYSDANPFKPNLGFTSSEEYGAAFLTDRYTQVTTTTMDVDLKVDGVLASLPAGDLRTSITLSSMKETSSTESQQVFDTNNMTTPGYFDPDSEQRADGVRFKNSWGGKRTALSAEFSAPATESLLLNAVVRKEQFDHRSLDDANLWSIGMNWSATDWMTVRLNRNYGESAPDAVLIRDNGAYAYRTSVYLRDEAENYIKPYQRQYYYRLYGADPNLEMEQNYTNTLGINMYPMDGLEVKLNFSDSQSAKMIRQSYRQAASRPDQFTPEYAAAHDYIYLVPDSGIFDELPVNEEGLSVDRNGNTLSPGEYVIDGRYFNSGSVHTQIVDATVNYHHESMFGELFASVGYQYFHKYDVSNILPCTTAYKYKNKYGFDLGEYGNCVPNEEQTYSLVESVTNFDARNVVGNSPVPLHTVSLNLTWAYKGLSVNAFTRIASDTSYIASDYERQINLSSGLMEDQLNIFEVVTTPARSLDINATYDFGSGELFNAPDWLSSSKLSVGIGNAFYSDSKVTRNMIRQDFDPGPYRGNDYFSPYGLDPRGRSYSVSFRTTFE